MRSSQYSNLVSKVPNFSHLSSKQKGLILAGAAAALIATGAAIPKLNAAEPVMVKCVDIKDKNACPNGCPHKTPNKDTITTQEACIKMGGKPIKIEKKGDKR